MKQRNNILILLVLVISNVYSQKSLMSFPTPEAAELGKYGQVPVSYFNGLPEISIPLYKIQCKDIELPISLSYHADGNKPDEHPTWVGLGWNLNCGGMITRIVNGVRDELTKEDFMDETSSNFSFNSFEPGYYYRANEFDIQNWAETLVPKLVGNDISYNYLDTQPDEFIFNFGGHSGSFWFVYENGQLNVKVKSKDGEIIKVQPILYSGSFDYTVFEQASQFYKYNYSFKVGKTFQKFIITTRDGYKYEFGGDISNIDFTTVSNELTTASSWHLTKIISPNNNYISFEYVKGGNVFIQRKSNYFYAVVSPQDNTNSCTLINNSFDDGLSLSIIHPKYLSKITTSTGQVINFTTSKTTELDYNNWADVSTKYSKICKGLLSKNNAIMTFNWTTDLPKVSYYMKLDRIEIAGVKNLNFYYTNDLAQRLKLSNIGIAQGNDPDPDYELRYSFSYNTTSLPSYNSRKTDNWGYYNNNDYSSKPYSSYSTLYNFRIPDLTYCKAEILENITYPTGGSTAFDYELNQYSKVISGLEFNNIPFTLSNSSGFAGGLRIKTITNYSDLNDLTKKTTKSYTYTNSDGSSSGILSGKPIYNLQGKKHIEYHQSGWSGFVGWSANANFDVNYYIYSQNQLLPLSTTNGNHVTYSRVIEQESDGSKTIYYYTNHDQYPDEAPTLLLTNMDEVLLNHFTSKELERGLLAKVQTYNSNSQLVKETNYTYNDDINRYNNYVKTINRYVQPGGTCFNSVSIGDFIRFSANKIYTFYPFLKTKVETVYDISGNYPVTLTTNYTYNSYNLQQCEESTSSIPTVSTVKTIKTIKRYSSDLSSSVYALMNNKFMLSYPIEITSYSSNKATYSKLTSYKSFVDNSNNTLYLPEKTYSLETTTPLSSFTSFDGTAMDNHYSTSPEIEYLNYGSFGNIYEVKDKSGINTTYLWSYNYQYPIAEVKNATYAQVKATLSVDPATIAGSATPDMSAVDLLRTKLPAAQVTTYTYKPLVGMLTDTDPRGVQTSYTYDTFNRLFLVLDNNKNILGKYSYGYQNAPDDGLGGFLPITGTVTPDATTYEYGSTGNATCSVKGGSGNYSYRWGLYDSFGYNINDTGYSNPASFPTFSFICSKIGILNVGCQVTDKIMGNTVTLPKSYITCAVKEIVTTGTVTKQTNFNYLTGSVSLAGNVVTLNLNFTAPSEMTIATKYLVANVSDVCRPSYDQTITFSTPNIRDWSINIDTYGDVYLTIVTGASLMYGTSIGPVNYFLNDSNN